MSNLRVNFRQTEVARLSTFFQELVQNKQGVTAIEYALIAALIAVAAIAAFTLVGTNLSTTFSTIASQL
jgi:pilus assembly protein Flp/PilA